MFRKIDYKFDYYIDFGLAELIFAWSLFYFKIQLLQRLTATSFDSEFGVFENWVRNEERDRNRGWRNIKWTVFFYLI